MTARSRAVCVLLLITALASSAVFAATSSGSTNSVSAVGKCSSGPVTVGYVPKLDTDPYFKTAATGMRKAMKEIGGKLVVQAPSQATGEAQIPIINNLVSQRVGVIAIAANDPNVVASALKRAAARGVKVITMDSDASPSARAMFVNQAPIPKLGDQMIESMGQLIGYDGEFAILSSTPTATNQNAWIAAIKKHLNEPKYSKMKLVTVAYGQESEQVNQQQTNALVSAYPDLEGIIVPAGIGLPAAARALEASGKLGKIKLTGLAPASIMRKYILSGAAQDIWWNVPNLGYLTWYTAQAYAQCRVSGKTGQVVKAGKLGTRKIGAKGEVLLGPAEIVTKDNINNFPF